MTFAPIAADDAGYSCGHARVKWSYVYSRMAFLPLTLELLSQTPAEVMHVE